ncbi:hypothetical protein SBV1_300042 [Verrucomicrobia bacterium]|nr:hypothetical protein SBV1_300042 [Verrucomicrobiota bacterium]
MECGQLAQLAAAFEKPTVPESAAQPLRTLVPGLAPSPPLEETCPSFTTSTTPLNKRAPPPVDLTSVWCPVLRFSDLPLWWPCLE